MMKAWFCIAWFAGLTLAAGSGSTDLGYRKTALGGQSLYVAKAGSCRDIHIDFPRDDTLGGRQVRIIQRDIQVCRVDSLDYYYGFYGTHRGNTYYGACGSGPDEAMDENLVLGTLREGKFHPTIDRIVSRCASGDQLPKLSLRIGESIGLDMTVYAIGQSAPLTRFKRNLRFFSKGETMRIVSNYDTAGKLLSEEIAKPQ